MKLKNLLLSLAAVGLLSACSDDDLPFVGSDNTINAFAVIAASGETYPADITGDEITVTVPVNVSLDGATADYSLCEQASISPDPAGISDWNSPHNFSVKAYDGTVREYTYSVKREEASSEESVVLRTQTDVQALAASGVTVIKGDLVIGENASDIEDPVSDLSSLSAIKEVCQNIIIRNSFAGESLAGLENLRNAAGLFIGDPSTELTTEQPFSVSLPSLKTLGQLSVSCNKLESLDLPSLEDAGWLYVASKSIKEINLPAMKNCLTNFTILSKSSYNEQLKKIDFPSLEKVGINFNIADVKATEINFPKLTSIGGYLKIADQALVELKFPELLSVRGDVGLSNYRELTTMDFGKLQTVTGNLETRLSSASKLAEFKFNSLRNIGGFGFIEIPEGAPLESLDLSALCTIGDKFTLYSFYGKQVAFSSLVSCKTFELYSVPCIEVLDLSKVTDLENLTIFDVPKLKKIITKETLESFDFNFYQNEMPMPELSGLKRVTGKFRVQNNNNKIITIQGIESVGNLEMLSCGSMIGLRMSDLKNAGSINITSIYMVGFEFPALESVENNFQLAAIRDLDGSKIKMEKLKTIGGKLVVEGLWSNLSVLDDLSFFSGLESAGSVNITKHPKLKNFSPLKNVASQLEQTSQWSVSQCGYNPTLNDMKAGKYK